MPNLILIETSTSLCSVALSIDGRVAAYRESATPRAHASMTAPFVGEALNECGLKASQCDAVCVSAGPGSYTGLRVGSSTAKGLCFAAGLPLIAVDTLEILVRQAIEGGLVPDGCRYIVPMIDARRMEVYSAVFSPDGKRLGKTSATVVDEGSFAAERAEGPVLFIGDGAGKCETVLRGGGNVFAQQCPRASAMAEPAGRAFESKDFRDTAYFEPFYLKEFVATVSNKKIF